MPNHLACDLASTRHVEPSGTGQPVDTSAVQAGQTVLLMGQNVRAYCGLYTVSEGQWQRHPDLSSASQMEAGTTVFVRGGAEHALTEWFLENTVGLVESDGLYFKRRSYATAVRAGGGLEIDEMNAVVGIEEKFGVAGDYQNPIVSLDARGMATAAESGGFAEDLWEGLKVTRLSQNSVQIGEGQAWIPGANGGAGGLLEVYEPIVKSGLTIPASTWVYLFLWDNGGVPDVEVSTQRPASPYFGEARVKGGPDNTDPDVSPDELRRYIPRSALYATEINTLRPFAQLPGGLVRWVAGQSTALRAVMGATNTVVARSSVEAFAPPTASGVEVVGHLYNPDNSSFLYVSSDDDGLMPTLGAAPAAAQLVSTGTGFAHFQWMGGPVVLGASRYLRHAQSAVGPSRQHNIDVIGYYEGA